VHEPSVSSTLWRKRHERFAYAKPQVLSNSKASNAVPIALPEKIAQYVTGEYPFIGV
jgi:hypothetical protein